MHVEWPSKNSFALDLLHPLACLWACEDGLWRRHPKSKIASFVFQYLKSHRENGFSKKITRAIRLHLSKDVTKNEKYSFISKSLCIASITKMSVQQGVIFFDSHARSGNSIGTNKERYLYQNILALKFPGANALNGWLDETPNKLYPTFH